MRGGASHTKHRRRSGNEVLPIVTSITSIGCSWCAIENRTLLTRKARLERLNPLFTIEIRFPKLDVSGCGEATRGRSALHVPWTRSFSEQQVFIPWDANCGLFIHEGGLHSYAFYRRIFLRGATSTRSLPSAFLGNRSAETWRTSRSRPRR